MRLAVAMLAIFARVTTEESNTQLADVQVKSPLSPSARAVAVAEFPVVDPEDPDTLPVTFPVRGPEKPVAVSTWVVALYESPESVAGAKDPVAEVANMGHVVVSPPASATVTVPAFPVTEMAGVALLVQLVPSE
jgi:hypothetical protein